MDVRRVHGCVFIQSGRDVVRSGSDEVELVVTAVLGIGGFGTLTTSFTSLSISVWRASEEVADLPALVDSHPASQGDTKKTGL